MQLVRPLESERLGSWVRAALTAAMAVGVTVALVSGAGDLGVVPARAWVSGELSVPVEVEPITESVNATRRSGSQVADRLTTAANVQRQSARLATNPVGCHGPVRSRTGHCAPHPSPASQRGPPAAYGASAF
jgi:hypothetical protein